MSTLTALKPRPFIFMRHVVTIELVLAKAEDLKMLVGNDIDGKPIYKRRVGMIYWLKSSIRNEFEQAPRILTENDNPEQIKEWLDHNMIYIAKNSF